MGQKPDCVLCPNKGGAMKSTRSGQKWAHVSCALWIPEVSIGSVDRMEPITKISSIPQSRWALVCVLCRERVGACIQCSVKTCKIAYHVTCAFQHGLELRAVIEDENAEDGIKLRSYCQKHSVKKEPKNSANAEKSNASGSEDEVRSLKAATLNHVSNKKKVRKEMTTEERNLARLARLNEIQSEFDKHVSVKDISCHVVDVDQDGINHIYTYWILKRKSGGNHPLLMPKAGDVDVMSQNDQEQAEIEKMKMFVHLRQDLERVRNLCYMVSRREKFSRSYFKIREQIFHKQMAVLSSCKKSSKLDDATIRATMEANHGPSIYDVLYSSKPAADTRGVMKIDEMIDAILGNSIKSPREINGSVKKEKKDAISRYTQKFNGGIVNKKANSIFDSLSSDSDNFKGKPARRKSQSSVGRYHSTNSASSSEDESKVKTKTSPVVTKLAPPPPPAAAAASQPSSASDQPKKRKGRPPGSTKKAAEEKRRLMNESKPPKSSSKAASLISSTDDEGDTRRTRTRLDYQHLSDESDELVPIKNSSGHSIPTTGHVQRLQTSAIYSDSDSSSTDKDNKTDNTVSDSQQQPFRTKAAMKEFNINDYVLLQKQQQQKNNKKSTSPVKTPKTPQPKKESKTPPAKARRMSTKPAELSNLSSDSEVEDVVKKEKDVSKDFLVVPQRQAAKKAQENLKTTSVQSAASTTATNVDKSKKTDESIAVKQPPPPPATSTTDKKLEKSSTTKKPAKEEPAPPVKKPQKEEKDFPLDFPFYVPQRQAAKKAAEHIKGLGTSVPSASSAAAADVKSATVQPATPTPPPAKKPIERRKSVAVDLSSSSTSSSSSGSTSGSSSDSDTEPEVDTKKTKAPPARRPSMSAAGLKQKAKDSPFLDKSAKSKAPVRSSSSSSSSDSDSSASDRPDTSRLSEKRNSGKRKSVSSAPAVAAAATASTAATKSAEKKPSSSRPSSPSKKPSAAAKKETAKSTPAAVQAPSAPTRRQSTAVRQQQQPTSTAAAGSSKAATASRSPQKLPAESANLDESSQPVSSSRKRSTSTACPPPSTGKSTNNNRTRAVDSTKGDPVKLPNEDVVKSPKPVKEAEPKRRKSTAVAAVESPKTSEKIQPATLRRSSRSDSFIKSPRELVEFRLKSPEQIKQPSSVKSEVSPEKTPKRVEPVIPSKVSPDIDDNDVKMDIDLTISIKSPIGRSKPSEPQLPSPMVSIPVMNLNAPTDDIFNDTSSLFNPAKSLFSLPKVDKEATERDSYDLIAKLRQKNNNAPSVPDNNNIEKVVPESQVKKSPLLQQNEKEKPIKADMVEKSPQLQAQQPARFSPSVNDTKKSSPWNPSAAPDSGILQHRNILTANNNKINADPTPRSPVDSHQKLAKINEENSVNTNRANHFHPSFGMANDQMHPNIAMQQHMQMTNHLNSSENFLRNAALNEQLKNSAQSQPLINAHPMMLSEKILRSAALNEQVKGIHQQQQSHQPMQAQQPQSMISMFNEKAKNFYQNCNENAMQNNLPAPVSLFPPSADASNQVQIPFPSPGQAMYPPSFANTTFTSSQQQMQNAEQFGAQNFNQAPKVPAVEKVEVNKKSPSKSTRSSPRNSTPTHHSGGKTPQKSPAKSPRQSAPIEPTPQPISRQNSNQKGKLTPVANEPKQRKSRTNSQASPAEHRVAKPRGGRKNNNNKSKSQADYMLSMTHKKLIGTPYEFDDDEFGDTNVETLKGLRDRKSSDIKTNKINRDGSSQSPKVSLGSLKHSTFNNHVPSGPTTPASTDSNPASAPVDMRTTSHDAVETKNTMSSFEIDKPRQVFENQENELKLTIKTGGDKQKTPTTVEIVETKSSEVINIIEESVDSEASFNNKVTTLSDSRNQLKVKIKGPLGQPDLHLNAITNPVIPPNVFTGTVNAPANPSSSRKPTMRKKELLAQYWNQGAADQEPQHQQQFDQHAAVNASRFTGFPKAVDSMELYLDDEIDYSAYKKRKRFGYNDGDSMSANNCDLNNSSNDGDAMEINKKRRRANNRGGQQSFAGSNPPPKLKIKIGSDLLLETSGSDLPPKKRLTQPQQHPNFEELKRDYMNYRKQIMDDFSDTKSKKERTKEEKRDKKEKKKKKKEKKKRELGNAPMKLILKIGNKSVTTISKPSLENTNSNSNSTTSTVSSELTNKSQTSPAPLKLKISRNSQGNGEYNVMNSQNIEKPSLTVATPKPSPSLSNNNLQPPVIDDSAIKDLKTTKQNEILAEQLSSLNENAKLTPLAQSAPPPTVPQAS